MNRLVFIAALLAAATVAAQPAPRAVGNAGQASAPSFDAFRLIGSLNIFNPNRVGPVNDGPRPHVDTISLVGTMDSDQGRLAFFDSSDGIYRKALHVGEKIAEYTVTRIDTDSVELTRDSKSSPMAMGQQLRRPPGGDWEMGIAPMVDTPAPAELETPGAPNPADAPNDTVRKMMERRLKAQKQ